MAEITNPYEYFAFISYKREDEKWAKWLQKKLESYSLPTAIRKDNPELPNKIRPVFRDQSELSGGNLKAEIEKGLNGSKYLIVICSPRSAQSPWVSKEVQHFIDQGREEYIIPFIIGGTPNASNSEDECFPEGLRQLKGEKEILGININEMGREAAAIKVIARMFNLRFDSLWQRFEKEKRNKRIWIGICALILIVLSLGIAGYIARQNLMLTNANKTIIAERDRANNERDRAERANKDLAIANDSISNNLRHIKIINDSLDVTNSKLSRTLSELNLTNNLLTNERDNVISLNWDLKKKHAKSVAAIAKSQIEKGNIIQSILALLTVIPQDNEMPYTAEVENALRLAYDKINLGGWIHTMLDGYYETIRISKDHNYIFLFYDKTVDVIDASTNLKIDTIQLENLADDKYGLNLILKEFNSNAISDDILAISWDSEYSLKQNIEYYDENDGEYYSYSLLHNDKEEIAKLTNAGRLYNSITGIDEIVRASFSPNSSKIVLSFRDGHNELLDCSNGNMISQWHCNNCEHYSNWNVFGDNQFVLHSSRGENGIVIYDGNTGIRTDSIPGLTGGEIFNAISNESLTKIWLLEENVPIIHNKINRMEPRDYYEGFHIVEFTPVDQLDTKNGYQILNKNGIIECYNSRRNTIWEFKSHYGCTLISLFDDEKIVIINNSQRFYEDYAFINIESGEVVYQISDFKDVFLNNENEEFIFSQTYYIPNENSAHHVLSYKKLIEVCRQFTKGERITKYSKSLFNL